MFDWSFGTLQVADLGVSNLGPATSQQLLLSHLTSKKTPIELQFVAHNLLQALMAFHFLSHS